MPGVTVICGSCGIDYEPTKDRIVRGQWRTCPACSGMPVDLPTTACEGCGRPLRAGNRTLCLRCLGVPL